MTQTLQWGLTTLQQIQEIDHLEKSAMQLIAQVMQAPLAALVTWFPGRQVGNLAATVCADEKQAPKPDTSVSIHSDPLIRQTLANDGLLTLTAQDLDANTRQWLAITSTAQVLAIALRTAPEHEPCGVVIVADHAERFWAERHLHALGTIVSQLSWSRRYLLLTQMLSNQREELERLNWYKILRLEELYRVAVTTIRKLNDLFGEKSEATPQPTTPPLLQQHRYRDAIRQLSTTLGTIAPVIQKEQWRLQPQTDTILLSTLLRRSLERVDHLIQLRQLWSQIHNLPDASSRELSALSIQGDTAKIEQVVYELMATACRRSQPKGRIDIWPRLLDAGWLELSITDNGTLEPRLLEDLETGRSVDLLAPSLLNYLPGLHLLICRSLIQQSKGELTIHKLEDGRILSRLVLPLAEIIP
jgi:signal transduction histidine kinase